MQKRRRDILTSGAMLAGALATGRALAAPAEKGEKGEKGEKEDDVSPTEDLMREHGLVMRVLGVYGEALRRIDAKEAVPAKAVGDAARIVRRFVEDYHEKLEEEHVFPRLEKAGQHRELVGVLRAQHAAGRRVTDAILALTAPGALKTAADHARLSSSMTSFIREYNPHIAREDTVVFPAFHRLLSEREFDALGEKFEDREHQLFGAGGFESMVDEVAAIEKSLGIDDLAKFTA